MRRVSSECDFKIKVHVKSASVCGIPGVLAISIGSIGKAISNRAERKLAENRQEVALLAGDKIKLLQELVKILIDPTVSDTEVRMIIYKFAPENKLRVTFDECECINEPLDENFFKLHGKHYSYLW